MVYGNRWGMRRRRGGNCGCNLVVLLLFIGFIIFVYFYMH